MFERKVRCSFVIILLILTYPVKSHAVSKFMVKPKLAVGWRFDSNYFKEETNETEVRTYLVQPGIDVGYETAKSLIVLNYTLDAHYYDDKDPVPSRREIDDIVGHTLSLKTRTKPFDRLTLGLDESFYKTRDPYRTDVLSNYVTREEYSINRLTPRIVYEFVPKFTAGLRYRWTEVDFSRDIEEDSTEHRGIFDLIYHHTKKASFDLQYQHWKMDYDLDTSDYTSDQIKLIFKRRFRYSSFEVGGGYHERSFDEPGLENIDMFPYHARLKIEKARSHVSLSAERNFDIYHEAGDYLKAHRFVLELGHIFRHRIPFSIQGIYQKSDYEGFRGFTPSGDIEGRDDDAYRIQGSLGYIFNDWVKVTTMAGYEDRDSNLAGFDYENEYFVIKLEFSYDIHKKNSSPRALPPWP